MLREIFRFELIQQLRSPLLWVLAAMFALLGFGAASSDAVVMGGSIGNVHRNAPVVIANWLTVFTIPGMLVITLFISGAMLRDFEQGTADLYFSGPVRKRDYLAGRLGAAFSASFLVYLVMGAGIFVAQFMPWIEPQRLGPVSLAPYAWAFALMVLPNVLFSGAVLALMAAVARNILWIYIGVLGFLVLYSVSNSLSGDLENVWLSTLLDPMGLSALRRTLRYWSAEDRNSGLPAFTGYLLANRVLWTSVALALLAATFALFRTERTGTGRAWFKRRQAKAAPPVPLERRVPVPRLAPTFGLATTLRQFSAMLAFDLRGVFASVPFLVMLAFGLANFIPGALQAQTMYGTPIHPVTSQMLSELQGAYSWLLVIIALFYSGELVWRERGVRIHEVSDALPVHGAVPLVAKFLTLVAVVGCFQVGGGLAAVTLQLVQGHAPIEPMVYAKTLALDSVIYVLMGGLALCLQVFTNSKFIGYALLVLVMVLQGVLGYFDLTHNLYNFGSWPIAPWSDMNGYGHFAAPQLWFQAYWGALLAALLLLSVAFWVRGTAGSGRERLLLARRRLRGGLGWATAVAFAGFAAVGGFLYWNTNVLNPFVSPEREIANQIRYEKDYRQYEMLAQPRIVASSVDVDLWPEEQRMAAQVRYRVRNRHDVAIPAVHLSMQDDKALVDVDLGGATLERHDAELGYRIYRLDRPLAPGEEREFSFALDFRTRGFGNDRGQTQFVENGSFFNNTMFPGFGYNPELELEDPNERVERGMPAARRMPALEDEAARASTYLTDDADWIDFETTVCTAPDQVALSPGYLKREFRRDGRRCFSYAMDRPMHNFYAYLSGRWTLTRGEYKGIPIEVYHDPRHGYNVARMIDASRKSLAYFEANFSPYQHRQLRIVEFPGYAQFAQSFANTIPYSESIGFIADLRDEDALDYVFYVTAHEVAHQWWAHQVIGANVQGATMLSESLAQYSALMVMEQEYGRDKMRRFLRYELDRYLSGRARERDRELPLYRVENQAYIHYQKGSLAFYRLRDELGEAAMNRALKRFLADKGYQQAPYTTSAELLGYLRAEATPAQQALVTDLFEKIIFHDNRVESANARPLADGRYEVTIDLRAARFQADGVGKEEPIPLDDWIEVAVFARGPSGEEADERALYSRRHHVTRPQESIVVTVDERPYEAGFDPYNKLVDRVAQDNRRRISFDAGAR
ncbi:MAG: M1 family aminopeptidase [Arenimonas sp.]|nr:M1 family aminopeptidase [Arenimonas sp.]